MTLASHLSPMKGNEQVMPIKKVCTSIYYVHKARGHHKKNNIFIQEHQLDEDMRYSRMLQMRKI